MKVTLPYRVSFLCPEVDVAGPQGDAFCEILLQWLSFTLVQSDKLIVIPPERFAAIEADERMTYAHCVDEEGLAERYMHARVDEVLWLDIDTQSGTSRLRSRPFMGEVATHGEMSGPFSDAVSTVLAAWAQSRGLGPVVDVRDRVELADMAAATALYPRLVAAIDAGDVDAALQQAGRSPHLQHVLLAAALRKTIAPVLDDRLLQASAPRTVRALRGDALAYAYFAWSLAPDDAETLLALAETLFARGRYSEAQRMADRATRIMPSLGRAHALAVRATGALDRLGEAYAEALERKAIGEESEGVAGGELNAALDLAREAVGLPTDRVRVAYFRGDAETVAQASSAPPLLRARALLTLGRAPEAAAALSAEPSPTAAALLTLAEAWAGCGREAAALWMIAAVGLRAPQDRTELETTRLLRLFAGLPIVHHETAITAATSPALRGVLARQAADSHPDAARSTVVLAALIPHTPARYVDAWLDPLREALGTERAERLDRLFTTHEAESLAEADRMIGRWHAVIERFASEIGVCNPDNPDLAPTLTYVAAQATARYLTASTRTVPSVLSLAYRQIATEALSAARVVMLDADEAAMLLLALDPALAGCDRALADCWFALIERGFDLELVLGAHRDAYCEGLDTVAGLFLGDEHLGALHAQARSTEDFARLARHTGETAFYDKGGDALLARLVCDPRQLIDVTFPSPPTPGPTHHSFVGVDIATADKAVARDPSDYQAWLALLSASNYRVPGSGNDLPAEGLDVARRALELSVGVLGASAGRLRLHAARLIESRCFAIDRLPPVE